MNREIRVYLCTNDYRRRDGGLTAYWLARWIAGGKEHGRIVGYKAPPARRADQRMSRRAALKACRQLERELNEAPGRALVGRTPLLGQYAEAYIHARRAEVRPKTLETIRTALDRLVAFLGPTSRMDGVHRMDARAFRQSLAERGLAQNTVRRYIVNVSSLFKQGVEDGIAMMNPFKGLAGPHQDPPRWHYVTVAEHDRLVAACEVPGVCTLLSLCRFAGLRRGEALHALWEEVDWQKRRLTIRPVGDWKPKSGKPRTVPLCQELYDLLGRLPRRFPFAEYVCGLDPDNWRILRDFKALCAGAGLEPWTQPTHALRKSCITDWAASCPMHVVKEWAGHRSIQTTAKFYLAVTEDWYQRAAGVYDGKAQEIG